MLPPKYRLFHLLLLQRYSSKILHLKAYFASLSYHGNQAKLYPQNTAYFSYFSYHGNQAKGYPQNLPYFEAGVWSSSYFCKVVEFKKYFGTFLIVTLKS